MKKFFTLIAFAFAALTASASVQLDFPGSWGSSCVVEGTTYSFNGTWAGAGTWLGSYDATGYDYAVCTFENHTGADINFGVTYNIVISHESWGDNYKTVTTPISGEKGYVAIALDKESKYDDGKAYYEELRQVQLQDAGAAGALTVTGVYLMTTAEYEALSNPTPTEGVFKLEGINCGVDGAVTAWSWNQQATNDSQSHQDEATGEWIVDKEATYDYKDASAYDYIVVQFEKNDVGAHFICVDNTWTKQISTDFVAGATYVAVDLATSEVGTFKDNITCFVMQPFADGQLKVKEVDYMTAAAYQQFLDAQAGQVNEKDLPLPGESGVVAMSEDEGGSGWHSAGWQGMENLSSLYKTFVVEFTAEHPFRVCAQNWPSGEQHEVYAEGTSETKIIAYPIGDGADCIQGLGQYAITNKYITEYGDAYMDPTTQEMIDGNTYGANKVTVSRAYLTNQVVESTYTPWVDPTGISEVKADATSKVVKAIKNGRIVISANGAEYNVAGQLVK